MLVIDIEKFIYFFEKGYFYSLSEFIALSSRAAIFIINMK
jgi:hypothetical protein